MSDAGRFLRTARHLHFRQVGARVLHEAWLRVRRLRATREWSDQGAALAVRARPLGSAPPTLQALGDRWKAGEVDYLGLKARRDDWDDARFPKLWRYERHYHAELVALAVLASTEPTAVWRDLAVALVQEWRERCPMPVGDAWEPYPVARRVLNWSLAAAVAPELGTELAPGIAAQVRFLRRHLEHHLRGNHLVCDAAAIVVGTSAVEAPGLARAHERAMRLLTRELTAQVLPDGGYAERTAQYHAIVLRDALLAVAFARLRDRSVPEEVISACRRMSAWLAAVSRGEAVPYLNDAAPDATPPVSEVLSLAAALGLVDGRWTGWLGLAFGGAEHRGAADAPRGDLTLPDTGWAIVREGTHELLFDFGPIGPDEQPGHGHSDALGFELLWDGHPVVTDSGITTYERGDVRDFERSSRAHATVTVGGDGPDELWAAFRVGARGRVTGDAPTRTPEGARVLRGMVEAPAGWTHRRTLVFWPGEAIVVLDAVTGATAADVRSHLPLDPACHLRSAEDIETPAGPLQLACLQGVAYTPACGSTRPRDGWVGAGFGRPIARSSVTIQADDRGRVAYALMAPGRRVSVEDGACAIRGPRGVVRVPLAAE